MVEIADLLLWILGGITLALALYFGLRGRRNEERTRRVEERVGRTEEKLDSLLRLKVAQGEVVDMGEGRTVPVEMHPEGTLGWNYTLVAEPAVAHFTVPSANLKVSERREEE